MSSDDIVFLEGARTPIGRFLGGLCDVSATELGAIAARGALERSGIGPEDIDGIWFGNVIQSSKDAAYLARHVGLKAGCPVGAPAVGINMACGSGIEAAIQGSRALRLGEARCALVGGAENMSMTPYALRGTRRGWPLNRGDLDDVLMSALYDPMAGCSIGETVEHLAEERGIGREEADAAAVEGQRRAARAQESGRLGEEIVAVTAGSRRKPRAVDRDEAPRPGTTAEALAALPGLFRPDGVVTAGNSCGLNDAAAALVMTTGGEAERRGWKPLGRLVSHAAVGVPPRLMGLGPIEATRRALALAGLEMGDLDVVELNDSFTVQAIAVTRELGLDPARVNPNGGAVALGHPMAATGARLLLSALYELRRRGGGRALCTVCIGGGQGIAAVVAVDP